MSTENDLCGKAAIVTGASRNLGRGFAVMLARRGANVVVHYNAAQSRADAEATLASVRALGVDGELVQADLATASGPGQVLERTEARFGRLDILVNNAGIIVKKPFAEITDDDFARAFAINARAPFELMRGAAQRIAEGGRIVNIGTSILACSFPFYSVYAASKAALEHLTRGLAKELAGRKVTVNTVAPGALDTAFFYGGETKESAEMIKQFTGGLGAVDEVVPTVAFLTSAGAGWLTGQTLFVNGGFVTR
jgi:NAD(P)-dependent dehydrogenase (short-subunit alcohol dehydrogenase family)